MLVQNIYEPEPLVAEIAGMPVACIDMDYRIDVTAKRGGNFHNLFSQRTFSFKLNDLNM